MSILGIPQGSQEAGRRAGWALAHGCLNPLPSRISRLENVWSGPYLVKSQGLKDRHQLLSLLYGNVPSGLQGSATLHGLLVPEPLPSCCFLPIKAPFRLPPPGAAQAPGDTGTTREPPRSPPNTHAVSGDSPPEEAECEQGHRRGGRSWRGGGKHAQVCTGSRRHQTGPARRQVSRPKGYTGRRGPVRSFSEGPGETPQKLHPSAPRPPNPTEGTCWVVPKHIPAPAFSCNCAISHLQWVLACD